MGAWERDVTHLLPVCSCARDLREGTSSTVLRVPPKRGARNQGSHGKRVLFCFLVFKETWFLLYQNVRFHGNALVKHRCFCKSRAFPDFPEVLLERRTTGKNVQLPLGRCGSTFDFRRGHTWLRLTPLQKTLFNLLGG